jgi:hypothetical protein
MAIGINFPATYDPRTGCNSRGKRRVIEPSPHRMKDPQFTHSQASDLLAAAAKLEAATIQAAGSRLSLDEVREAAEAAGIDPRFVDAAMHATAGREEEEVWLGVPVRTVRTLIVPGRMDADTWGRVVAAIRDSFGAEGATESIGNSRRWSHHKNVVTAEPAGDDTLVQVTMDRSGVTKGMGYTSFALAGTAAILGTLGLLTSNEEGLLFTAAMMAMLAVIYGSVSFILAPLQHRWAKKKIDKFADRLSSISGVTPAVEKRDSQAVPDSTSPPVSERRALLDDSPVPEDLATAARSRVRES